MVAISPNANNRLRHQYETILLQRLHQLIHYGDFVFQLLLHIDGSAAL